MALVAENFPGTMLRAIRETPDAVSVRFELPEALREAFAFKAGQHLTFRRDFGGEEMRRNYSVCVSPSEGVLKIGVKKIAGGAFSSWVTAAPPLAR